MIVNKYDTVSPSERGQVLEFVKERLAQYFFSREPLVFSVSARQALDGKQSENNGLVESNGIRQLEEALFHFLTEEKAEAFLANIKTRVSDQRRRAACIAIVAADACRSSKCQRALAGGIPSLR